MAHNHDACNKKEANILKSLLTFSIYAESSSNRWERASYKCPFFASILVITQCLDLK